jgi:hypothetical protein
LQGSSWRFSPVQTQIYDNDNEEGALVCAGVGGVYILRSDAV